MTLERFTERLKQDGFKEITGADLGGFPWIWQKVHDKEGDGYVRQINITNYEQDEEPTQAVCLIRIYCNGYIIDQSKTECNIEDLID